MPAGVRATLGASASTGMLLIPHPSQPEYTVSSIRRGNQYTCGFIYTKTHLDHYNLARLMTCCWKKNTNTILSDYTTVLDLMWVADYPVN